MTSEQQPKQPVPPDYSGDPRIAIGGDIVDSVVISGNYNTVNQTVIKRISNFFAGDTERQALRNRKAMLELVSSTWIEGVLEKSLFHEVMIQLNLEERPGAVEHPWEMQIQMPEREIRSIPAGASITDVFHEMKGAMLILGEPGSGKTTLLLELTRDCLARAETDENAPIPVFFNLSSWEKGKSLDEWLIDEFTSKYFVARKLANAWVSGDDLQLLLDGLDEVRQEHREACVHAINDFRQRHGLATPIVVCTRIADYEVLTTKLMLTSAVILQPLTSQQIDRYFKRLGPELHVLHQILDKDAVLYELAKQPLLLSIMTLAYPGMSVDSIVNEGVNTVEVRRKHLFDTYVERMFARIGRTRSEVYTSEQTKRWLAWMASKMNEHGISIFLIERIRQNWLDAPWQLWINRFSGIVLVSGIMGFSSFLLTGLITSVETGLLIGRFVILISIMVSSFVAGLPDQLKEQAAEVLGWSWKKALRTQLIGLMIGLAISPITIFLMFAFLSLLVSTGAPEKIDIRFMIIFTVLISGVIGFILGTAGGIEKKEFQSRSIPNQGTIQSLKNAAIIWLIFSLIFGSTLFALVFGLLFEVLNSFFLDTIGYWVFGCLLLGTLPALGIGLYYGGNAVLNHFVLRLLLYQSGKIPWDYVAFLDYAAERILLHKVGGGYIFVHRLLMEHFTAMYQEEER